MTSFNLSPLLTFSAEVSEKSRKELENKCNHYEERNEATEKEVMTAKKTTLDACEKYEETAKKINHKEKNLEKIEARAEAATKKSTELEQSLNQVAKQMGSKQTSRERVMKRGEQLTGKLRQLTLQLQEAEHRATQVEDDQKKLEMLLQQMKQDRQYIVDRTEMAKQKSAKQL